MMQREYSDGTQVSTEFVDGNRTHHENGFDMLVAELGSTNAVRRQQAREALVMAGPSAVPSLIEALGDEDVRVRWEAAKSLFVIRDARAIEALVLALHDESFSVRWLAAEALVRIGPASVVPVLRELIRSGTDIRYSSGAHHVLRAFSDGPEGEQVRPVLAAIEGGIPSAASPTAFDALRNLTRRDGHHAVPTRS